MGRKKREMWKCIGEREFDGDIVITDPCYLDRVIGLDATEDFCRERGLVSRTFYGDWGCTVYKTTEEVGKVSVLYKKLGEFTADVGMVCVIYMEDALELDPEFGEWIMEHEWCVTVIRDFKGKVRLMTRDEQYEATIDGREIQCSDTELRIHGDGTIGGEKASFESVQTSI